ncbi:triadin isoform X16 [Anas platyrhynchos]|uniref:triadin isoform X16 n=1 Tax=Anas platyrhynchos TaxID=8839 RepID=UPI003AF2F85F
MAETAAEGRMSMTTTIIDGKNGSVPSSSMKVGKKSVTEDLVTTFSSPAAWLLVVALIVTWSAVAIVMFDLVDYKAFAATYSQHCDDPCLPPGRSVNKLSTEPLRIIHETLEESTDWLYGFISLLSDIIWSDDDDTDEGEVESSLKKEIHKAKPERHEKRTPKVIHRDKPEKQEKIEKKEPIKVTHKDKTERQEKPEKKEKHTAIHKEKSEKPEKHEKKAPPKVIQKDKPERHEKAEKKTPPKEEKKVKSTKVEAKVKKEVKDGKGEAKMPEKVKQTETKTTEVGLIKAKPKVKEEKALQTVTKSEKKDQYAFCRYVIDMFAQGDFYPGHKGMVSPRLLLEHSPRKKTAAIEEEKSIVVAKEVKKRKDEKKRTDIKRSVTETKKKEKEGKKEKAHEKTAVPEIKKADKKEAAVSKELKKPAKYPAANPSTKKAVIPETHRKEKMVDTAKTAKKESKVHASVETLKSKAVPEKKEEKAMKAGEQDKPKMKQANPGKDKELKSPAATKDKEHTKEKEGKNPADLKDKESLKGKNPKNPEGSKDKETGKRKDVRPSAVLKEKGKEMKVSTTTKEKGTSEKTHEHKHETIRHEKDVPTTKPVKLKTTAKPTGEIPITALKKTKTSKDKEEKTTEKKHLKEEKHKGVPPVKEVPRHHNLTSAPVRYFQCVFINGPNGFGLQFPTNLPSDKEEKTHSKTSKRKTRKPGQ